MRIAIDIDNVIADTVPTLLPHINNIFKTNLLYDDIYMYDFHTILGISNQEMKKRFWNKSSTNKLFTKMKSVKNAKNVIAFLSKKHKIVFVTDRPKKLKSVTREWLNDREIPLHRIRHMAGGIKNKHSYAELEKIRGFGFDVFIEDKLEDAILLSKHCKKVILYKRPWNISKNVRKSFVEVDGWNEILKVIEN
jgi:uncharacterized HAD superfamily protein